MIFKQTFGLKPKKLKGGLFYMKKLTLGLIIIGIVLIVANLINASISGVALITPVTGANLSGTSYLVNWTNNNSYPGLYLQYRVGGCGLNNWLNLSGPMPSTQTTYLWDTTGLNGIYCLKIYDSVANETISGNISVDNTNPTAALTGQPYTCNEGANITLNASTSSDGETGIMSYEWEIDGDGLYDDGVGITLVYTCPNGPAIETIGVRVRDYANNTDTTTAPVNISNVAPVCNGITAFADSAVTEPVIFTENATDIADALSYNWDFDDGSTNTTNPTTHVFNSAGTYNVTVNVSDGTDSCLDYHVISIVDPILLPEQEVMALQNLDANFTPMQGSVANSFATGLTGGVACTKRISEPSGLTLTPNGNDCVVTWNSVPNNDNGVNYMIVRVDNGTDAEYYAFNTTVYSWKINLTSGWNLISIPVIPNDNTIQAVIFDNIYDALPGGYEYVIWSYQFDGTENKWLKSRRTGYGDLDYIEAGHAYWINMANADILYGFGDKLIAAQSPPTKTIVGGWNLIGHYGLLTVAKDDALKSLQSYLSTVLDGITGFDPANFDPVKGYWISTDLMNGEQVQYTPSNESYNFN